MRHGTAGRNAVQFIRESAGRSRTSAYVRRTGTQHRRRFSVGTPGAEFRYGASVGGTNDAAGLGGDQRLMIDLQKDVGFHKLCFDDGSADGDDRLSGEDHRSLRHRPYVAGKAEGFQIGEKIFIEDVFRAQIVDVVLGEAEIFHVVGDLLQSRGHGISASVGIFAVENVKVRDFVRHARFPVSAAHGEFVKVAQQCKSGVVQHQLSSGIFSGGTCS